LPLNPRLSHTTYATSSCTPPRAREHARKRPSPPRALCRDSQWGQGGQRWPPADEVAAVRSCTSNFVAVAAQKLGAPPQDLVLSLRASARTCQPPVVPQLPQADSTPRWPP
jgi:hypothetical protein